MKQLHLTAMRLSALAVAIGLLGGCVSTPSVALPPVGPFDYQLGGPYPPDSKVTAVARDRTSNPAAGIYSICYINAFQTQPGEADDWPTELLLEDGGQSVTDPDWPDEFVVDTSDPRAVVEVVKPWIEECAATGFDAVEFDNLDSYTRFPTLLRWEDTLSVASALVRIAHENGMAAGQKNSPNHARELKAEAAFDFAVVEQCVEYDECDRYTEVYGEFVLDIEYASSLPVPARVPFSEACATQNRPSAMILRDRGLSSPGEASYVYEDCSR